MKRNGKEKVTENSQGDRDHQPDRTHRRSQEKMLLEDEGKEVPT